MTKHNSNNNTHSSSDNSNTTTTNNNQSFVSNEMIPTRTKLALLQQNEQVCLITAQYKQTEN